jgi:hypothetical protein
MSTHRPGCHGYIGADLEFVSQQALQRTVVHKEHHHVGERATNLEADAPSPDS